MVGGEGKSAVHVLFCPFPFFITFPYPHPTLEKSDKILMVFVCLMFVCLLCLFLAERIDKEDIL